MHIWWMPLLALLAAPAGAYGQVTPSSPLVTAGPTRDEQARPKTATGRLSGRVTAGDSGKPLRRAEVIATSPEVNPGDRESQRSVTTDADGR